MVDFVRQWSDKTELPQGRLVAWIGIGDSKFHDWKQRFGQVNEHNAWIPRDHWLTSDERGRIVAFAGQYPLEGYRRLTYMMIDADVVACSAASVYRVLKGAGMLAGCTPIPSKKGTGFVQPLAPHEHWHTDISFINIAGTFYFLCAVLDGCSRFIVHWEIREKMEESDVETIIQRAREAYPDARPRIISDNGPQFIAKDFKEFVRLAGMTHVRTSPYYPQSNGKIERWHKTLKEDCIRPFVPLSLDDARRLVTNFVQHYNQVRLHSAIGYVTPHDKLSGKDKEIHAARDQKLAAARERRRCQRQTDQQQRTATHCADPSAPVPFTPRPIDFVAVRVLITMSAVLQLLQFQPRSVRGAQQRGPCPVHGSKSATSTCFSVQLDQQIFHCFRCGRAGNALDLWAAATKQPPYEAALDLSQRLGIDVPYLTADSARNRERNRINSDPPSQYNEQPPVSSTSPSTH